jgi:hypothetical protein
MTNKEGGSNTQIIIAIIGLIGVLGGALLANWDKIFSPKITPVLSSSLSIPKTIIPSTSASTDKISDTYLMDNQPNRVIVVTHIDENRYRIEESSSPWPWQGEATLDGGQLLGDAKFRNSLASMRVEGIVRNDGSIVIKYIFTTDDNGGNPNGRLDNHVWYPKPY